MNKPASTSTKPYEGTFSALFVLLVLFVLPNLGVIAMLIGSVGGFILYVSLFPDRFRTRSGSLKLAIGLASFLVLLAGIVTVMALTHQIK